MINENRIIVSKTARYYTAGVLGEGTRKVWIVLHGFRQTGKKFLQQFESLFREDNFFVAPEALNRFYLDSGGATVGATWMTREDRLNEIKDYVNYLEDLYEHFEFEKYDVRITALGFSQGASTLTRWVHATRHKIDNAIVYAGEVAPELLPLAESSGLRRSRNFFICGTRDEIFTPELISKMKDSYADLKFTEITFDGKHQIDTDVLKELRLNRGL